MEIILTSKLLKSEQERLKLNQLLIKVLAYADNKNSTIQERLRYLEANPIVKDNQHNLQVFLRTNLRFFKNI